MDFDAVLELFNGQVERVGGCWEFTGYIMPNGYGRVSLSSSGGEYVHRYVMQKAMGISQFLEGQVVCHRCDNRCCVRPDHLFIGLQCDNMRDMVAKGRACLGEKNGEARLTERDAADIIARYARGERPAAMAVEYGITPGEVRNVASGRRWPHLDRPSKAHTENIAHENRTRWQPTKHSLEVGRAIRERRRDGLSEHELAREFGVPRSTVNKILRGTGRWRALNE